jgi:hypothetical protein
VHSDIMPQTPPQRQSQVETRRGMGSCETRQDPGVAYRHSSARRDRPHRGAPLEREGAEDAAVQDTGLAAVEGGGGWGPRSGLGRVVGNRAFDILRRRGGSGGASRGGRFPVADAVRRTLAPLATPLSARPAVATPTGSVPPSRAIVAVPAS